MAGFMEQIEQELGVKLEETRIPISSLDILRLNNAISADSEDNERLLNESPKMADRFPCSK